MKKNLLNKLPLSVALFLLISATILSCKKKDPEPELPPSSSMLITFDNFWDGSAKTADTTKNNLLFAGGNVLVWNLILTVGLAVPVASFVESFKHEPKWNKKEKAWIWSYSVPVGNITYSAELHGKDGGDMVNWSMYISQNGGFEDFLWYTGTSRKDKTSGQWLLNDKPNNPTALLQIDWHANADGTSDIQYMNVVPGGAENGGYIKYGIVKDPQFDAFYDIYNKGQNNLTKIQWNRSSRAGRVQDEKKFNDAAWHCWDNLLLDTACP